MIDVLVACSVPTICLGILGHAFRPASLMPHLHESLKDRS